MASNPNWLEIFIRGLDDDGILTQLDCGSNDAQGTLVMVPPSLYNMVVERALTARRSGTGPEWRRFITWADFISYRCSREFIVLYLAKDPTLIERSVNFGPYMSAVPELPILAKLHEVGLLMEEDRLRVRDTVYELAVEEPDASWIGSDSVSTLLTDGEFLDIRARVRNELIPNIDRILDNWSSNEQGESAEEYYQPLLDTLYEYTEMFRYDESDRDAFLALEDAHKEVLRLRNQAAYWTRDDEGEDSPPEPSPTPRSRILRSTDFLGSGSGRNVFDDVDE